MLFFRRCFFRLEWGDGGGSSLGLELSTSAGPLAGEGRVGEVWEEGGRGVRRARDLPRATGSSTLNCGPAGPPWESPGEGSAGRSQSQSFPSLEGGEGERRRVWGTRIKGKEASSARAARALAARGVEGGPGNSQGAEAPAAPHQIYPQSHSPLLTINSRIRNNQGAA